MMLVWFKDEPMMLYQVVVLTPNAGWQTYGPILLSRAEVELLSAQAELAGLGDVYVLWAPTLEALGMVWNELKARVQEHGHVLGLPSGEPTEMGWDYWHARMDKIEQGKGSDRDKPYSLYLNNDDRRRWVGLLARVARGELGGKDDGGTDAPDGAQG